MPIVNSSLFYSQQEAHRWYFVFAFSHHWLKGNFSAIFGTNLRARKVANFCCLCYCTWNCVASLLKYLQNCYYYGFVLITTTSDDRDSAICRRDHPQILGLLTKFVSLLYENFSTYIYGFLDFFVMLLARIFTGSKPCFIPLHSK